MIVFNYYSPDTWEGYVKNGLVRENTGVRLCQCLHINEDLMFNKLAKKDGALYNLLKEKKYPFYVDRLQGGDYIQDYSYDKELLDEYRKILGDKFWGFQMHEWMSNYSYDLNVKLGDIPEEEWTEENIEKAIYKMFPGKELYLESMTLSEMVAAGKPKNFDEFYKNITELYKKRIEEVGDIIPCDSFALAYDFEFSAGSKRICPEVGWQITNGRIQVCYARGMTRKKGRSFGVYYETWGGDPLSSCTYCDGKNEWGVDENSEVPFKPYGPNGGSSRSLQKRVFLYAYLSNAEFLSEEWGGYNPFNNTEDFELSPYGIVKRDFLDFCDKYSDVGEKLSPIAVVLPADTSVYYFNGDDNRILHYDVFDEKMNAARRGVNEIFTTAAEKIGNEYKTFKNYKYADAVDILNRDEEMLDGYKYLIDFSGDEDFKGIHNNTIEIKDLKEKLCETLPCNVEGDIHWLVNQCTSGGYYLTIFNNNGVNRTVAEGEKVIDGSDVTVSLTFKNGTKPILLEGDTELLTDGNKYRLTIKGGEIAFIKFQ